MGRGVFERGRPVQNCAAVRIEHELELRFFQEREIGIGVGRPHFSYGIRIASPEAARLNGLMQARIENLDLSTGFVPPTLSARYRRSPFFSGHRFPQYRRDVRSPSR